MDSQHILRLHSYRQLCKKCAFEKSVRTYSDVNIMPSSIVGAVNPDLENERKKCNFNVDDMARWWNGGEQKLNEKRELGTCYYWIIESTNTVGCI